MEEPNSYFSSEDGALYNDDKTTLICCPGGKVGTFTIPDGVTEISGGAFDGCGSLTSVMIPSGVAEIGDVAFAYFRTLRDVYYAGSETDWAAINIHDGNTPLTSANIHYNSTGPEPGENDTIKYRGISGDTLLVKIEVEPGAASDTVFCAFYDGAGRMVSVQSAVPVEGSNPLRFAIDTGAVRARVFLLDGESVPQCASVSVSLP